MEQQAMVVKGLMNTYVLDTGDLINLSKCSILLSDNCDELVSLEVKNILEISNEALSLSIRFFRFQRDECIKEGLRLFRRV